MSLDKYWLRDRLWGDDLGPVLGTVRLAVKIVVAAFLALLIHQGLVHAIFDLSSAQVSQMQQDVNSALSNWGIDVTAKLESSERGLAYQLSRNGVAENETHYFYRLTPLGKLVRVTHPQIEDSIDVMLRRIEKVWKGEPLKELHLCAETRKMLDTEYCSRTENVRNTLSAEAESNSKTDFPLMAHLRSVRIGAMILGLVQWLTVTLFIFAVVESVGLYLRWIQPKSFLDISYAATPNLTMSQLENDIKNTTDKRVRNHLDRFMEKGTVVAKISQRPDVRDTLRNFRDHLIEDAVAKQDLLEMLGDTMLKIAFMGTIFGIGTALYYARDLDAADPLMRLSAKAQMYAGIGLGFGATIVGIGLSIIAAKFRMWLSQAWSREIEDAWLKSSNFFDRFSNYPALAVARPPGVAVAAAADGAPVVTPVRRRLYQKGESMHWIDRALITVGAIALIGIFAWLSTLLIQMIPKS